MSEDWMFIQNLHEKIKGRKSEDEDVSYVAGLFAKGTPKIAQKMGEEAVETVIAATSKDREETIKESADLLFHLMVLWADADVHPEDVINELRRREGISGLEEKRSRQTDQ